MQIDYLSINNPKIVKQKNFILILTEIELKITDNYHNNEYIKLDNNINGCFYRIIKNDFKLFKFIVDFKINKYREKNEIINLTKDKFHSFKNIIDSLLNIIRDFYKISNNYSPYLFARSLLNSFLHDFLLFKLKNCYHFITIIHLPQFVKFDVQPEYEFLLNYHTKFIKNVIKIKFIDLEDLYSSFLYGKSLSISVICISFGILVITLSIINVLNFWNIIFGIIAILGGILWLFPIK